MGQPILLLVTDQGRVLEALAGDLGRRFGTDYRILGERSPADGAHARCASACRRGPSPGIGGRGVR